MTVGWLTPLEKAWQAGRQLWNAGWDPLSCFAMQCNAMQWNVVLHISIHYDINTFGKRVASSNAGWDPLGASTFAMQCDVVFTMLFGTLQTRRRLSFKFCNAILFYTLQYISIPIHLASRSPAQMQDETHSALWVLPCNAMLFYSLQKFTIAIHLEIKAMPAEMQNEYHLVHTWGFVIQINSMQYTSLKCQQKCNEAIWTVESGVIQCNAIELMRCKCIALQCCNCKWIGFLIVSFLLVHRVVMFSLGGGKWIGELDFCFLSACSIRYNAYPTMNLPAYKHRYIPQRWCFSPAWWRQTDVRGYEAYIY